MSGMTRRKLDMFLQYHYTLTRSTQRATLLSTTTRILQRLTLFETTGTTVPGTLLRSKNSVFPLLLTRHCLQCYNHTTAAATRGAAAAATTTRPRLQTPLHSTGLQRSMLQRQCSKQRMPRSLTIPLYTERALVSSGSYRPVLISRELPPSSLARRNILHPRFQSTLTATAPTTVNNHHGTSSGVTTSTATTSDNPKATPLSSRGQEPDHRERISASSSVGKTAAQSSNSRTSSSSGGGGTSIEAQMIQQGPIELSTEQQFLIKQVIEKKKSVFFTGSAGTGKSVLLRQLIEDLKMHYLPGNVAVTASTGIAACNIGGCTLHSFAGVGLGKGSVEQLAKKILENKRARARWRKTKVLIIDEISMIPADLFDKLEEIARILKKSQKPFGGIQLIITGDFFQLPPVVTDAIVVSPHQQQQELEHQPSATSFLPSPSITQAQTTTVIKAEDLAKMGQDDEFDFIPEIDEDMDRLMDSSIITTSEKNLGLPTMEEETMRDIAETTMSSSSLSSLTGSLASAAAPEPEEPKLCFESRAWKECIDYTLQLTEVFRQRDPMFIKMLTEMRHGRLSEETCKIFRTLRRAPDYPDDGIRPTELYALRRQVDAANHRYLAELPGPLYIYEPQDSGPMAQLMDRHSIAPSVLQLKENAQVMLIKNLSPTLVNGSMGIVVGFQRDVTYADNGALVESHFPVVRFQKEDVDYVVRPEEWRMEMPNGDVIASRIQIPLILAWAISIHKSQGQTMERVKVDMGKIFEVGQAYVALSRATSLQGLQVLNFDRRAVQADERVANFYSGLETVKDLMEREEAQEAKRMKRAASRKRRKKKALDDADATTMELQDNATVSDNVEKMSPDVSGPPKTSNVVNKQSTAAVFQLNDGASLHLESETPGMVVQGEHDNVVQHTQWLEMEKKKWLEEAKKQWLRELEERQQKQRDIAPHPVTEAKIDSTTLQDENRSAWKISDTLSDSATDVVADTVTRAMSAKAMSGPSATTSPAASNTNPSLTTQPPPNYSSTSSNSITSSMSSSTLSTCQEQTVHSPVKSADSAETATATTHQHTPRTVTVKDRAVYQVEKPIRSWKRTVTILKLKKDNQKQ